MTPNDPESLAPSPEPLAPPPQSPAPSPQPPFWGYLDLAFFISLLLPSLFLAALIVKVMSPILPYGTPFQALLGQLIAYAFIFSSLYFLIHLRYGQPFWRSLGWTFPLAAATASFLAGPLLAITVGLLGNVLRTPEIPLPFQDMLANRPTVVMFAIFVVILGPLCEELAFRGFLMPLLVRSFGPATGIIATGLLFGSLHGPEYGWHWQQAVLISVAGMVFGWVRFRTGSTAAAALMHSTYNLTQLAAFFAQNRTV
jgi:membrane protease YdiL (CAAX protease family)